MKTFLASGGFPATTADLKPRRTSSARRARTSAASRSTRCSPAAAGTVAPGWSYLPYQLYANSIFGDTVGKSYQAKSDLDTGLKAWQDALVAYGNQQGFQVNG